MPLTDAQIERYSRQIILPEIGGRGQERLRRSAVGFVGCSGVARTAALYLAAAGVGGILSYDTDQAMGGADGQWLRQAVADLNPEVCLRTETLAAAARGAANDDACDLVLSTEPDGLARGVAVGLASRLQVPLVLGVARGGAGWVGVFGQRPCAQCWDAPLPASAIGADDPATAGVVASLAALTALKLLLGIGDVVRGTMLQYDGRTSTLVPSPVTIRPDCPACGAR